MDFNDLQNLAEAYTQVNQQLDEAEGSYGKTPKAREAMGKLAIARREKPASEYSQKGEKTKKVKEIEKHTRRLDNGPDVGNRGKKSTKPRWSGMLGKSGRGKLDQDSRDYARDSAVEYTAGGHKPGPGTVTKNPKKLRKQKAMGEFAKEDFDTYEFVLTHLLEEGYASTEQAADKIILNMSESWFEEIIEARRSEKEGMGSPEERTASGHLVGQRAEKKRKGEMGGRHFWSGGQGGSNIERGKKKVKGAKEDENKYTQHGRNSVFQGRTEKSGKYSAMQSRKRGSEIGSRFD